VTFNIYYLQVTKTLRNAKLKKNSKSASMNKHEDERSLNL